MANRIPQEFIDEVTSKTDIVDVIGRYVQLKKAGKNLFGLCPFHEEKTASFSVAEDKQIFHCFSCGRGGNVFKFIMEMENKSFPEAVIEVANLSNIPVPDSYTPSASNNYENSDSRTLIQMYKEVTQLYNHILMKTENGSNALKYLNNRDIDNNQIEKFSLGYAPNNSSLLVLFFKDKDISDDILKKSGLFVENDSGELFDRFRDRIMVPITDESGNVVAFSGRILDKEDNTAKYLNSPETPIFNKSKILFNLSNAKRAVRETNSVILFEGFMDVLSADRAGISNGVASMGTSLTDDQLYTLSRITKQINICYDGDNAGVEATYRALSHLNDNRFNFGVISIPGQKDPDEYIRENGSQSFKNLVNNAIQTPIAFNLSYLKRNYNLDNERDQLEYLNKALGEIAKLNSPVEIDIYLSKVSEELNISVNSVKKEFDSYRRRQEIRKPANNYKNVKLKELEELTAKVPTKFDKIEKSELSLMYWAIKHTDIRLSLKGNDFTFLHDKYQQLFNSLIEYQSGQNVDDISISEFMNYIDDNQRNLLAQIEMMRMPDSYSEQEIADYINNVQNSSLESQYQELEEQLKQATLVGNIALQLEITQKLIKVKQQLTNR
ncbi:DNA primase [Lactobacillus terrae]|uniref:DNA primase n=1 Tax=Lactobacillus terrae TaxID=2269374 RepID=UPI000C1B6342|nr:DNA primase [Lactobacillus terrae]